MMATLCSSTLSSVSFVFVTISLGRKRRSIVQAICLACRYVGAIYQLILFGSLSALTISSLTANVVLPNRLPHTNTRNLCRSLWTSSCFGWGWYISSYFIL